MSTSNNSEQIFMLLKKLSEKLAGDKHEEALKQAKSYMLSSPIALRTTLPYDEISLTSRILQTLQNQPSQSVVLQFHKHHEQLKKHCSEFKRKAFLSFIYLMAKKNSNFLAYSTSESLRKEQAVASLAPQHVENVKKKDFNLKYKEEIKRVSSPGDKGYPKYLTDFHTTNEILQSVLYSFMGIEGKHFKKDIISAGLKLDVKYKFQNKIQAGMLLRLSKLGYYHDQIKMYMDAQSGRSALGIMGQSFISFLQKEITNYYGLVASLQQQVNIQKNRKENIINHYEKPVTLMTLLLWSSEPLHKLQWLYIIGKICQERKGGALASKIYNFLGHGDPTVKILAQNILSTVCKPLQHFLACWILEGEINDPYAEFFIECLSEVDPDRLWYDKYRVRIKMLPKFISKEMAKKILVTGKSINFLRKVCKDNTPIKGKRDLEKSFDLNAKCIFTNPLDSLLQTLIDTGYRCTSQKVLDIVLGPNKLLEHLQAMRRYMLLGQGDFIGTLLESLKPELDKQAKELYSFDLSSIMEAAIRSTNAQYDDPEILNNLGVRLMIPHDGDTGWDIFFLHYTVLGPLATILEPSMHNYQILFKPLWRMKHIEFLLSSKIWRDQMCNAKAFRKMHKELRPIMLRLNLYTSELIHFINQMQYYILFEVIECSWSILLEKVHEAQTLDDIVNAHNEFLEALKSGGFLDVKSDTFSMNMEEVYLGITRLEVWQDRFFSLCFKELHARNEYEMNILKSEETGKYGSITEKRLERDEEKKYFEQFLENSKKNLHKIGNDCEIAIRQFLLALNSHCDHNLLLFGMRLDFNEYYKKRDKRLGVPLTFEHMRMSNILLNSKVTATNCSKGNISNCNK